MEKSAEHTDSVKKLSKEIAMKDHEIERVTHLFEAVREEAEQAQVQLQVTADNFVMNFMAEYTGEGFFPSNQNNVASVLSKILI